MPRGAFIDSLSTLNGALGYNGGLHGSEIQRSLLPLNERACKNCYIYKQLVVETLLTLKLIHNEEVKSMALQCCVVLVFETFARTISI